MIFDLFLSPGDAKRASRVLEKLAVHGIPEFALTGGLAIEMHLIGRECGSLLRKLNDLDFVVESFNSIPDVLAETFLVRHVHPNAPEGKTLLQLVDPEEALRIDIFRAFPGALRRTRSFAAAPTKLASPEDLTARDAALILDLEKGLPVPPKYVRDFQRLIDGIDLQDIETVWQSYRKPSHPATFQETPSRIRDLVRSRANLLIEPDFSRDPDAVCPRCQEVGSFRLASSRKILSILGYC